MPLRHQIADFDRGYNFAGIQAMTIAEIARSAKASILNRIYQSVRSRQVIDRGHDRQQGSFTS